MAEKEKKAVQKVVIKPTSKINEAKTTTKKGTATKAEVKPVKAEPKAKATPKAKAEAPKPKPVVKKETQKKEVEPKAEAKVEVKSTKVAAKAPAKVEAVKPVKTAKAKTVYHVSKRDRDGREWKVFIQGSEKVIKLFATQLEALDYAQSLCKNKDDGSYVVLHRLDGKIRKY